MPVAKGAPPSESVPTTEAPADPAGASSLPAPSPVPAWEYTAPFTTVYHLPLTAHPVVPAVPAVPATDEGPGSPAVPGLPATVFAWPDGPPDDRWAPTTKSPNQAADNCAPLTSTEV